MREVTSGNTVPAKNLYVMEVCNKIFVIELCKNQLCAMVPETVAAEECERLRDTYESKSQIDVMRITS